MEAVAAVFAGALLHNDYRIMTSTITVAEVLVRPLRMKHAELAKEYEEILFNTERFTVTPIDAATAKKAAAYRAEFSLKTPDALQLASASVAGADYFLTNDKALKKTEFPKVVLIDDLF